MGQQSCRKKRGSTVAHKCRKEASGGAVAVAVAVAEALGENLGLQHLGKCQGSSTVFLPQKLGLGIGFVITSMLRNSHDVRHAHPSYAYIFIVTKFTNQCSCELKTTTRTRSHPRLLSHETEKGQGLPRACSPAAR